MEQNLRIPILAPLLHHRAMALSITGMTAAQCMLVGSGLPGWQCPFFQATGIPCPGCGLSRAIVALLHGDWQTCLTIHAFAPLFLLVLLLIGIASFLPDNPRQTLALSIERIERYTGLTAVLLIALVGYWAGRLIGDPAGFMHVIAVYQ